jgi:F0F1-type ATP synthase gamma subunit
MRPIQTENVQKQLKKYSNNLTPSQIESKRDYNKGRRMNMTEELNEIVKNLIFP